MVMMRRSGPKKKTNTGGMSKRSAISGARKTKRTQIKKARKTYRSTVKDITAKAAKRRGAQIEKYGPYSPKTEPVATRSPRVQREVAKASSRKRSTIKGARSRFKTRKSRIKGRM